MWVCLIKPVGGAYATIPPHPEFRRCHSSKASVEHHDLLSSASCFREDIVLGIPTVLEQKIPLRSAQVQQARKEEQKSGCRHQWAVCLDVVGRLTSGYTALWDRILFSGGTSRYYVWYEERRWHEV